jgi:hypothetical protein
MDTTDKMPSLERVDQPSQPVQSIQPSYSVAAQPVQTSYSIASQPVPPAETVQPTQTVATQTPPEMQMKHYTRLCTRNKDIMTLKENMTEKQAAVRWLHFRIKELNVELANAENILSSLIETQVVDIKLYNSNYPDGYLVQDTKN